MHTHSHTRAVGTVLLTALLTTAEFGCGAGTATPADEGTATDAPRTVEVGVEAAADDSEHVAAVVHVQHATPAAGDGHVRLFRRARLAVPGVTAAFTMEGVAGAVRHGILVVVDSGGAVRIVTHKWSTADNSVVAQTDCGPRHGCPASQIAADPRTGAVVFSGLVLTGLDGNTGDPATSTLTGRVP
jgi:hypothetical protein